MKEYRVSERLLEEQKRYHTAKEIDNDLVAFWRLFNTKRMPRLVVLRVFRYLYNKPKIEVAKVRRYKRCVICGKLDGTKKQVIYGSGNIRRNKIYLCPRCDLEVELIKPIEYVDIIRGIVTKGR